jgi:putative inorganic carbon (HCO3(-)) transporter
MSSHTPSRGLNLMITSPRVDHWIEHLLLFLIGLLPLLFWPNLEHPFSGPKLGLLCFMALLSSFLLVWRGKEALRQMEGLDSWAILLWLFLLSSSALLNPAPSFSELLLRLSPLPLYFALCLFSSPHRVAYSLGVSSTLLACISLLQWIHWDPFQSVGFRPEHFSGARMRVYGTLGNPNFVAAWIGSVLPFYWVLHERLKEKRKFWAGASLGAMLISLSALAATGSRVFWLALLPMAGLFISTKRRRFILLVLGLMLLFGIFQLFFSPSRSMRTTLEGRLYINTVTGHHLAEIPWAGFGPGAFESQFARWQEDYWRQGGEPSWRHFAGPLDHAHNDFLEFLVNYGFAGLAVFLVMLAILWRRLFCLQSGKTNSLITASRTSILILSMIALVDFPWHRPAEWGLLWIFLALLRNRFSAEAKTKMCGS